MNSLAAACKPRGFISFASRAASTSAGPPAKTENGNLKEDGIFTNLFGRLRMKLPENKSVGYEIPNTKGNYLNPLITPPPRSPSSPEDFRFYHRLGHWRPFGFSYTSPVADRYYYHEAFFSIVFSTIYVLWIWSYGPDYKLREWSRREAFLRTSKREALGLPLIDRNVVDPERVVLPTEEELGDFPVTL